MLQPRYPLKWSDLVGPYSSITDIRENVKQNVKFLLMTSPGEWPGNPSFGVGLRRFLFSNYPSQELQDVHKKIKEQFSRYLPFVSIRSEFVTKDSMGFDLIDSNQVKLVVQYSVSSLGYSDTLTFDAGDTSSLLY